MEENENRIKEELAKKGTHMKKEEMERRRSSIMCIVNHKSFTNI